MNKTNQKAHLPFEYTRGLIQEGFQKGRYLLTTRLIDWVLEAQSNRLSVREKFELYAVYLDIYTVGGVLDSASVVLSRMEKLADNRVALRQWQPQLLYARGIVASMEERYFDALKHLSDIQFHHGDEIKPNLLVMVNSLQGSIFLNLQRYDFALPFLMESKRLLDEIEPSSPDFEQTLYNNLGIAYMRQDSFERAVECFSFLLEKFKEFSNPVFLSRIYHNLATTMRLQGEFSDALSYSDSTISLCSTYRVPVGVIFGRLEKIETLSEMKEANKAAAELEKTKSLLAQYPIPQLQMEGSRLAAQVYELLGDFKEAYTELKAVSEQAEIDRDEQIDQLINAWEVQLKNNQAERRALQTEILLSAERSRVRQLLFGTAILVVIIIGGILYIIKRRQREEILARLVEQEKENAELQLENKNRELASQSLDIQKALGIRDVMVKKLKKLKAESLDEMYEKLHGIVGELKSTLPEGLWEDFKHRFENVEKDFIPKLLEVCPDLSPIELKTATFLRLNLSTKEIASLTNRATGTVNNNRSALRKKLNIDNDENLMIFLLSL